MPVLDCSVKSCYYNKEAKCCLEGIRVEGQDAEMPRNTACGSFQAMKREGASNACKCGMNPERDLMVQCEAVKCMFNDNKKCKASHIGIAGERATESCDTECASFVKHGMIG